MKQFKINAFLLIAVVYIIDQWSKHYIVELFKSNDKLQLVRVMPSLNFTLTWNHGITFGLFSEFEYNQMIFSLIAIIVSIILLLWLKRSNNVLESCALGMVIGGALGNVTDRLKYGAVVDFIDCYIASHHWHTFNIADSAICIGVMLLITSGYIIEKKLKN